MSEDKLELEKNEDLIVKNDAASIKEGLSEQVQWSEKEERTLVRKIDFRIFPVLVLLLILNFVDRNNFANARLKGLERDLGLSDIQYQTCLSILLVGYVSMQVPSNMILNYISRPSLYLLICVSIWGMLREMISTCLAATKNPVGAIMCRFFLGAIEAAFFPGSLYYLSRWYTRTEMQLRVTILNIGNLMAQAFGGLIAAGILADMEGKAGIRAWRWLFIIEGVITITIALLCIPILPDYPETTKWLNEQERYIAKTRLDVDIGLQLQDDQGLEETPLQGLKSAVLDIKVWLLGITYLCTIMGLPFSSFFPTIADALGNGTTVTLLLTAPPWVWASLVSLPNAWHADKTGERFFHYAWPAISCMVGYVISAATHRVGPRYFAMFLMTTGYASGFTILAWISNTIPRSRAKRAAAIGIINAMGNIGSIPGSYIWPSSYGPYYAKSFWAVFSILGVGCFSAFVLSMYLRYLNKKLDAVEGVTTAPSGVFEGGWVEKGVGRAEGMAVIRGKGFRYLY